MTTRNLLIIAAVPGFRANTKLEREDNNSPISKPELLNLYADLAISRVPANVRPAKIVPRSAIQQVQESAFSRTGRELFEQEYLVRPRAPRNGDVNPSNDTVFYMGKWFTQIEARTQLPQRDYEHLKGFMADARMERAKQRSSLEQPKPRSKTAVFR